MCLKKRKHEVAISDLQMKLESVKKHHDNRLKQIENRILNIENRFDDRLNQIENRFAHLEGRQNKPDSRKRYDNVDDYYYGPEY